MGVRLCALVLLAACGGRTEEPVPAGAVAAATPGAVAGFIGTDGNSIGNAVLFDEPAGVRIRTTVTELQPGEHGFHIHAVGRCEPPFDSAGGHFNPHGRKHGALNAEGRHAGDLPNLTARAGAEANFETVAEGVTLASLFDADGSALVIHAGADDYKTDPAGNAGARIACAVIRRP